MDTTTEEYFQQVLEKVKEFEPWGEEEIEELEQTHGIEFPKQVRALFLKANDMVGWETSRFSLLTLSDIDEIFAGENVQCGEDFKDEKYDDLNLFPFATIEMTGYSKYIFLDSAGELSDTEGTVIWKDLDESLDPDFVVLENNLAEFLEGILKGVDYQERIVEFCEEMAEEADED